MQWKIETLTGLRPTGDLTVANYIGAVAEVIKAQKSGKRPFLFVADIHAITDIEPKIVKPHITGIVEDYIALGIDPDHTDIFVQSDLWSLLGEMTFYLMRHITVSELIRQPALKDKLRADQRPETANALLAIYPVLMAADILIQRTKEVPVGKDQVPHIEMTRLIAERFNDKYGEVLYIPKLKQLQAINIRSLKGEGKMSKTKPEGAIFLTDDDQTVTQKIQKAETAFEGKMTEVLESHIMLAKNLSDNESDKQLIDDIIKKHMDGAAVMGTFKKEFIRIVQTFLRQYRTRKQKLAEDKKYISSILKKGAKIALENAEETMAEVRKALWG
jgi:tryptophanyl-tRNA synthetase